MVFLFSMLITYVCVFCLLGVVYQSGPTRVHNGGVRLCIWKSVFKSVCSMGKKKFVVMAGFISSL